MVPSSWIPAVLSRASGSCIEELVFHLVVPLPQAFKAFDLDALGNILVQSSFPKLRTICVMSSLAGGLLIPVNTYPEMMGFIRRKLLTWSALGVVSF
jgi:hypothetical protein